MTIPRGVALAALAVMAVGAAGATLAVATGEATAEAVEDTPEARAARDLLREHGESGETSRTLFLILTVAYGALVIFPVARGRDLLRKADLAIHGAFLAAYALGCMQLSATGHLRGRLVHEKGVRAPFGAGPDSAPVEDDGRRGRGRGGDRR